MEKWEKLTYMVAFYMFLINIRPLEPFLTAYQIGPHGNISLFEVANTMSLIKTSAASFSSFIMFITADYFLYKPNIIFLTVWSIFSYFLMIGFPSVMQIMVSTAGIGAMYSTNMVAYSYLYVQIEDVHRFQIATGIVSAAVELGKVIGNILAEVIVGTNEGNYTALPYCNVLSMFLALICASLFPTVVRNDSFTYENEPDENSHLLKYDHKHTNVKYCEKTYDNVFLHKEHNLVLNMSKKVWINLKTSYSNPTVLKLSLWYIFGMAASLEVISNINVLYSYVIGLPGNNDTLSNGFSEALATFFGSVGAYVIGKVQLNWSYYGDIFTALCSITMGGFVMSYYIYSHLLLIYISYILFCLISQAHLVIIVSQIAKNLKSQCYSLVLVLNFLGASIISTIMMIYFTQLNFLSITIPGRFLFIGILFIILGIIFLFISLLKSAKK